MGQLVVTEFVTLDGVAQAPGGPDEDRDRGFQHGGWQAPLLDESSGADLFDQAKDMDALLLGRRTFDIFANYWPNAPEEIPFTGLLNRVPKYVASTTLSAPLAWDASLLEGDLVDAIQAVKDRHAARRRHRQPRARADVAGTSTRRSPQPVAVSLGARERQAGVR